MTELSRQGNLSVVEIADSARRHAVTDDDIRAAVSVPLRVVRQGDDRVLVIGADTAGRLSRLSSSTQTTNPSRSMQWRFVRSSTGTSEEG